MINFYLYNVLKQANKKTDLVVFSINTWSGRKYNCIEKVMEICNKHKVDVVCLQESPEHTKLESKLFGTLYKIVFWGGHKYGDYLAILLRITSDWKFKDNINVNTNLCPTKRIGISCIFSHPSLGNICIANVHLCGGGPDENKIGGLTESELIKMKKETLDLFFSNTKSTLSTPSLVVGDFNSDLKHYHTKIANPNHIKYLKEKHWSSEKIDIWNFTPFQFLNEMGLNYAINDNDVDVTSFSGTTPDALWYDPKIWKVNKLTKIDFMENNLLNPQNNRYSDHDGLLVLLNLII